MLSRNISKTSEDFFKKAPTYLTSNSTSVDFKTHQQEFIFSFKKILYHPYIYKTQCWTLYV